MFELPRLYGSLTPASESCVVFFSCDYDYFDRHGFALQQSINRTLGWMHVHCHIINEGNMNKLVLDDLQSKYKFTYTWEDVDNKFYTNLKKNHKRMKDGIDIFKTSDLDYIARRTYLASVRFMRLDELFPNKTQHVFQIDCDSILRNGFHQSAFMNLACHVGIMPKPKDTNVFIASALTLGINDDGQLFRKLFSDNMKQGFDDGCYWFIDQDILRQTISQWNNELNKPYHSIPYKWNAWGLKKDDIFSTGKGGKKNDKRYKAAQLRWLPNHWKVKIEQELRELNYGSK